MRLLTSPLLVLLLVLGSGAAIAQQRYAAPKTTAGVPDLQGSWTNDTQTPLERPEKFGDRLTLTAQEAASMERAAPMARGPLFGGFGNFVDPDSRTQVMRVRGQPRTSLITTTPNGRVPAPRPGAPPPAARYTSGAGAREHENPETMSLDQRCLQGFGYANGPVMLPGLYNNNYRIVQTKDSVVIESEMVHDLRIVRIGGTHRTDGVRPWFGDSIGRWEGDTLVVETTNFPQVQAFRGSWETLKVTERFNRTGDKALLYRFTVEDPTRWAAPWGGEYEFKPARGPLFEYACHEGNYTMVGVLAGARFEQGDLTPATPPAGAVPRR